MHPDATKLQGDSSLEVTKELFGHVITADYIDDTEVGGSFHIGSTDHVVPRTGKSKVQYGRANKRDILLHS